MLSALCNGCQHAVPTHEECYHARHHDVFLCAQVAERSLFLWNNEYIVSLVAQQRGAVLPLVFAALERNAASHWNPAVHGLTCNVRKMFQDMDEQLYEECRLRYEAEEVRSLAMA